MFLYKKITYYLYWQGTKGSNPDLSALEARIIPLYQSPIKAPQLAR